MIQITKKWFIDSDGLQYILFKNVVYTGKDGEEKERQAERSYHPTVSAALTCFLQKMQKKNVAKNDMSLKQAIEEFNKLEQLVIKSAKGREI